MSLVEVRSKAIKFLGGGAIAVLVTACGDPCLQPGSQFTVLGGSCTPVPTSINAECGVFMSPEEEAEGFSQLFDGQSLDQWRSIGRNDIVGWNTKDGCLNMQPRGFTIAGRGSPWAQQIPFLPIRLPGRAPIDLITKQTYDNFELKLDWKISPKGNSGIFIRGDESKRDFANFMETHEMQVLDNNGHENGGNPKTRAGAYYSITAPSVDNFSGADRWQSVHIIADGDDIEFRMNGEKVVDFTVGSSEWTSAVRDAGLNPSGIARPSGHIALQDHWDSVSFRNIRIKELP